MKVLRSEPYRITMADVDAARVIYFAAPYRWSEGLFTGWLAESGHPISRDLEVGRGSPCVASSARYLSPVRLDDEVRLELIAGSLGRTSFRLRMDVFGPSGALMVQVDSTFVVTQATGDRLEPTPIPPSLRRLLGGV